MKPRGRRQKPTEGAKLSGANARTAGGHNSGEFLKWTPKVQGQRCLNLSGQWTEMLYHARSILTIA